MIMRSSLLVSKRKLTKLKEEGKDNPKLGIFWYIMYCFAKSGVLILTATLFSLNNHPEDETRDLSPW